MNAITNCNIKAQSVAIDHNWRLIGFAHSPARKKYFRAFLLDPLRSDRPSRHGRIIRFRCGEVLHTTMMMITIIAAGLRRRLRAK